MLNLYCGNQLDIKFNDPKSGLITPLIMLEVEAASTQTFVRSSASDREYLHGLRNKSHI